MNVLTILQCIKYSVVKIIIKDYGYDYTGYASFPPY